MRLTDESIKVRERQQKEAHDIVTNWVNTVSILSCDNCGLTYHDLQPLDFTWLKDGEDGFDAAVSWRCAVCKHSHLFDDEQTRLAALNYDLYVEYELKLQTSRRLKVQTFGLIGIWLFVAVIMFIEFTT